MHATLHRARCHRLVLHPELPVCVPGLPHAGLVLLGLVLCFFCPFSHPATSPCSSKKLNVNPSDMRIVLTEPPMNPSINREKMLQIMFEKYNFKAVYVGIQAMLTLYAQGKESLCGGPQAPLIFFLLHRSHPISFTEHRVSLSTR